MAGVPTIDDTSHNKAPLLTCHDSSSCRASASGTGGRRLKTQVKVGRYVRLLPLAENFNSRPSPERTMHFESPQNIDQMRSPFIEKGKFVFPFFKRS